MSPVPHGSTPYGELLDLDAVTDADRAWFDAHPAETERWRPITPPEISHARAADETFDHTW